MPYRVNRVVAVASLLVLLALISPVQAVGYRSSWNVVESGTEADLLTAEAYGEHGIWAFGKDGVMVKSSDNGSTWELTDSPTSSDLLYSDSAHGALVVAAADGSPRGAAGCGDLALAGDVPSGGPRGAAAGAGAQAAHLDGGGGRSGGCRPLRRGAAVDPRSL